MKQATAAVSVGAFLTLALVTWQAPGCGGDSTPSADDTGGSSSGGSAGGGSSGHGGGAGNGSPGGNAGQANGGGAGDNTAGTGGAAGGSTSPDAGAAGAAGFKACQTGTPCKVLSLGDDIAVGFIETNDTSKGNPDQGDRSGYRSALLKLMKPTAAMTTFVGSQSGGDATVPAEAKNHEGRHAGTIASITALAPQVVAATTPNIVLVNVGSWDAAALAMPDGGAPVDTTDGGMVDTTESASIRTSIDSLIDAIATAAPNALIVIMTPPPGHSTTSDFTLNTAAFLTPYAASVSGKRAAGKHVALVNLQTTFKSPTFGGMPGNALLYVNGNPVGPWHYADLGLLPKDLGYQAIAGDVFKQAIQNSL